MNRAERSAKIIRLSLGGALLGVVVVGACGADQIIQLIAGGMGFVISFLYLRNAVVSE